MPFSFFSKSKPVREGPKSTPLADRVPRMDTKTVLNKHANARRKATESAGAVSTGLAAKLVTNIPVVGSFIPAENQIKSGEDHHFRGIRIRERQKELERELKTRSVQPTRYERSDRQDAFNRGIGKALNGDPARRL